MKRGILCVLFLLVSGSMLHAAPVVVTFDDLQGQAVVPSPYGGINWMGNWDYYGWDQDPFNPQSPPNRIYTNYQVFSDGFHEATFEFNSPAVFNGAYIAGGIYPGVYFNLYLGGTLVATSSTLTQDSTPTFLSSGYSGLVDKVGVVGYTGFYVMDNVTYDAAVPEPASLLLIGIGLGVVGLASRRR